MAGDIGRLLRLQQGCRRRNFLADSCDSEISSQVAIDAHSLKAVREIGEDQPTLGLTNVGSAGGCDRGSVRGYIDRSGVERNPWRIIMRVEMFGASVFPKGLTFWLRFLLCAKQRQTTIMAGAGFQGVIVFSSSNVGSEHAVISSLNSSNRKIPRRGDSGLLGSQMRAAYIS